MFRLLILLWITNMAIATAQAGGWSNGGGTPNPSLDNFFLNGRNVASVVNGKLYIFDHNAVVGSGAAEYLHSLGYPEASPSEVSNLINADAPGNGAGKGSMKEGILSALGAAGAMYGLGQLTGTGNPFQALAEKMGWSTPGNSLTTAGAPDASWGVNPASGPSPGMEDYAERLAAEDYAGGQQYLQNTGQSYDQFLKSTLPALTAAGVGASAIATVGKALAAGSTLDTALKLAGIAAPLAGALLGSSAIKNAAGSQLDAANNATKVLQDQFNTTRTDLAPWREAGVNALNQLTAGTAPGGEFTQTFTAPTYTAPTFNFQEDPGYQFRLAEGEKAIARAAAARRMNNSGATYKDLLRFGQNTASDEFDRAFNRFDTNRKFDYNQYVTDSTNAYNRFTNDQNTKYNRLAGIAGTGQTATNSLVNAGQTNASNIANNITGAGNVNAGATIAGVNALTGGIGTALKSYNDSQLLDFLKTQSLAASKTPTVGGQ